MDEATNIGAKPEQPASHELGSVPFSGRPDALFERHLLSDAVVEPSGAYDRQRLEALASRSGSKRPPPAPAGQATASVSNKSSRPTRLFRNPACRISIRIAGFMRRARLEDRLRAKAAPTVQRGLALRLLTAWA